MAHENWLSRRKGKQSSNLFKLDSNKSNEQNIKDIIQGLYVKKTQNDISPTNKNIPPETKFGLRGVHRNSSDSRRLSYLNALVTLLCKEDRSNLGFSSDELMTCIRISLVDESMVIRAAALRVLRYLIKTECDVATFNTLKLPYLVTRSIDLMLRNEEERAQALRVVRRVVAVVGAAAGQSTQRYRALYVDQGLLRCLIAVTRAGNSGDGTGDRLSRPAIATLAEICVLNPELFISCGGVTAVTRQLAECATPRMAEALCGVLLHTLNDPISRFSARIDLTCLSAPYCDFHFRPAGTDTSRDEREMRFTCSRLALLCVLRSWPGLLHFCHPCSSGGLHALVAALYLPRLEVRKAILDLLYELVGLPQPEWTDEISVALDAVDPSDFQDSWRLNEGFVAAEGTAILPHLSATGPDISEIHLALLLQCFLEAGLLDGLAEVIITSDTFISVRATVLLGQLLHLVHLFLPSQICSITPALPSLMSQASAGTPQALAAVAALRRLHSMLEARPATSSLFLDHIIQYCSGTFKEKTEDTTKSRKEKDNASMAKPKPDCTLHKDNSIEFLDESDNENEPKQRHSVGSRADVPNRNVSALVKSKSVSSRTSAAVSKVTKLNRLKLFERDSDSLIRCTLVMQNKDGNTWNWEIIRTILKENDSTPLLNLNDSGHKAWVGRIINYLKPSSNKYSHTDLSTTGHGHSATRAGCQLIRHLLRHNDPDSHRLLEELFLDVSRQIEAIETGLKAHGCLFSPQHMCNTMCQMYFLFIGQLCHSHTGLRLFKETRLYENLLELSTKTHHSCYVKLVISSLDYTLDSYPRDILAKTLTCNNQTSRMYTTQFLNVLLRASRKSRELVRRKTKLKMNYVQEQLRSAHRDENDVNHGVDMDTWILQMLVGQVKDESKPVVKCALAILEEAYSVPAYFDKLMSLKEVLCENCRLDKFAEPSSLDFTAVGDRGYLLWLGLEVAAASHTSDGKALAFLKKHLEFWTKFYNYRYVRLVEAGVHEALSAPEAGGRGVSRARRAARPPPHLHAALAARAAPLLAAPLPPHYRPRRAPAAAPARRARRARRAAPSRAAAAALPGQCQYTHTSRAAAAALPGQCQYTHTSRAARPPPHLHAALAARAAPLLAAPLPPHYRILQRQKCTTEQEIVDLKASLWAIGNTAVTPQGLQQLMNLSNGYLEDSVPVHIVRLAKYCPVYSVRATAFYVLGLLGSTYDGANVLAELGWLCVRHTRHDQFPVIPDEMYPAIYDSSGNQFFVTSPDRRFNYDADISEHSDHTDQSTAESLHSDITKHLNRVGTILAEEVKEQDVVDHKTSFERREPDKRKSHTLPTQGCSSSHDRPMLSESRTVDILRDCSNYERQNRLIVGRMNSLEHAHEGRVRNTSESSTSGVSSCDSFLGKYAIPDRILTLSPIPSSSSLYGMKSSSSTHRSKISELQRRTSTSSFTGPEVASSPPSQTDLTGFATLKSLNRRPHLSESAATGSSDLDDLNWLLSESNRRTKPFSSLRDRAKSTRERMTKLSLLEYDWKPLGVSEGQGVGAGAGVGAGRASPARRRPRAPPAPRPPPPPAYIGICLPRDLADLFPRDSEMKERGEGESKPDSSRRNRVPSFLVESSNASTDNKSRATPDSQKLASYRASLAGATGHVNLVGTGTIPNNVGTAKERTSINVLPEIHMTDIIIEEKYPSKSVTPIAPATLNATSATTAEAVQSAVAPAVCEGDNVNVNKGQTETDNSLCTGGTLRNSNRWRHSIADCLACVKTRPPSSHELREAFFAGMEGEARSPPASPAPTAASPAPSGERAPHAELLHHAHYMANPTHLRQTRSALLSLKQRHPDVFRSPCVYSDVCALLARDSYMLCARRFLQELFLDASFECFANEPTSVLARHFTSPTNDLQQ